MNRKHAKENGIVDKICTGCDKRKPFSEFNVNGKYADGTISYKPKCKVCLLPESRKRQQNNYKKQRAANKRSYDKHEESRYVKDKCRKYDLIPEELNFLINYHNEKCAICGEPETSKDNQGNVRRLAIDHCHKTGEVRGMLCHAHNVGLGAFQDNIKHLNSAIKYLMMRAWENED